MKTHLLIFATISLTGRVSATELNTRKINHLFDQTQAEITFASQLFVGKTAIKTAKAFYALDEIYGHVKFNQPIKYPATPEDYFDFDIAPSVNNSRDICFVDFASGVATSDIPYFQNCKNGTFILSSFIMNTKGEKMEEVKMSGEFSVDYSKLPAGDEGSTKLSEWERMIAQAARAEQVEENKKKKADKASGASTSINFYNAKNEQAPVFTAGEEIYGKIMFQKRKVQSSFYFSLFSIDEQRSEISFRSIEKRSWF